MKSLLLIATCACVVGCATSSDLTPYEAYYAGRATASGQIFSTYTLLPDVTVQEYVNKVGYTVAMQSGVPTPFYGFFFGVIVSEEVNAFTAPGGFIFVTTGTLKSCQNEDELAYVLAHEVAHHVKDHPGIVAKRAKQAHQFQKTMSKIGKFIGQAAGQTEEESKDIENSFGAIGDIGQEVLKGYPLDWEKEADVLGLDLVARRGYAAGSALNLFRNLESNQRKTTGAYGASGDHPTLRERRKAIEQVIAQKKYGGTATEVRTKRFAEVRARIS